MFIQDPDFYPPWISDLGSNNSNKREGRKKCVVLPFGSHKCHTIENYFNFLTRKEKKFEPINKYFNTLYLKKCHYALNYMVWDLVSRKNQILYPEM
jgi:hypothetical protein